jgi:beta-lactamase regulating signal transducer with metallopeptidase domain
MMLSISKIFWLLVILASVWYIFKIIEKRKIISKNSNKNNEDSNKKGIDAYKCNNCGLWSTGDKCNNKECSK